MGKLDTNKQDMSCHCVLSIKCLEVFVIVGMLVLHNIVIAHLHLLLSGSTIYTCVCLSFYSFRQFEHYKFEWAHRCTEMYI